MLEFSTAAKSAPESIVEGALPITFKLDDVTITAYPPKAGQMALMLSSMSDGREPTEMIAAVVDFLDGILDEEGRAEYRRRLLKRDDPFDFDTVQEIVEGLISTWTARPTTPPSVSSSSQPSGGPRSTAKRPSKAPPA